MSSSTDPQPTSPIDVAEATAADVATPDTTVQDAAARPAILPAEAADEGEGSAPLELAVEIDGQLQEEDDTPLPEGLDMSSLANVIEALMLAAESPLSLDALQRLIAEDVRVERRLVRAALASLDERYADTAVELRQVASGYRIQVRSGYSSWVHRLWQDKPPRLSRALMETLAIICYRQPVTRGEIEEIRGVTVSSNILRTLLERGWVREVGVKEVPGRPALFGSTAQLLDDLGLASLDDLPSLPEIKDPAQLEAALARLGLGTPATAAPTADAGDTDTDTDTDTGTDAMPVVH